MSNEHRDIDKIIEIVIFLDKIKMKFVLQIVTLVDIKHHCIIIRTVCIGF